MRTDAFLYVLLCAFLANDLTSAQEVSKGLTGDQAAAVRYAEIASVRALDFSQGNLASLIDVKDDFTAKGWGDFIKKLDGWLDDKGAPKFSSNFSPSGKALDIHREGGTLNLTIPGVLKHESRNQYGGLSTTAYRVEIDIQLTGKPLKIERLIQHTCGGAKTVTSCR
jgi:hypothetical protein